MNHKNMEFDGLKIGGGAASDGHKKEENDVGGKNFASFFMGIGSIFYGAFRRFFTPNYPLK